MHKQLYTKLISFFTLISVIVLPLPIHAQEYDETYFNPNLIISDFEFIDYDSMTLDDIQRFLVEKGSGLATYVVPEMRVRASQLIYDNAQISRINPKVILTKLQKEQSLIDGGLSTDRLDWATGYGICDSCSKSDPAVQKYRGFANQIDYAASALRLFYDNPQEYGFKVGQTYTIDGQRVTVSNNATHALYLYTPHLHGNSNFNKIYTQWFSLDFLDGSLLQDADTGGIFLVQHGLKRPFANMAAFMSRYDINKVITTSSENLDAYPLGPPIKYAQYSLLQDKTTGGVFLIVDDEKRPITSKEVFRQIGFNPEEIVPVDPVELTEIPTGAPITISDAYPTGGLLQDKTTGGVWYVQDGVRHAIWSKELLKVNFPELKLNPVAPEEIEAFTLGYPVQFKDGELVKSSTSPTVYVIANNLKHPIPDEKTFLGHGYKWTNIIETSEKALSLHLEGAPLTSD